MGCVSELGFRTKALLVCCYYLIFEFLGVSVAILVGGLLFDDEGGLDQGYHYIG